MSEIQSTTETSSSETCFMRLMRRRWASVVREDERGIAPMSVRGRHVEFAKAQQVSVFVNVLQGKRPGGDATGTRGISRAFAANS